MTATAGLAGTAVSAAEAGPPVDQRGEVWRRGATEVSFCSDYIWVTQGHGARQWAIPADGTAAWVASAILAALDGRDQALAQQQADDDEEARRGR